MPGAARRDGRDRGRALLQAQRRRLQGDRARRHQEPRVGQDRAGRLDDHPAARARALHQGPERNFERKIREAKIAWELEKEHSKTLDPREYLNSVPYGTVGGRTAIGVEAAAETFFDKHAKDLTLRESAMLAGLPQAPSQYNPFHNPGGARAPQRGARADGRQRLHHGGRDERGGGQARWASSAARATRAGASRTSSTTSSSS